VREDFEIAVVGGGIIGLAIAWRLTRSKQRSLIVLEKEAGIARHQTGHNSGVIHSGIYYVPGSAKARTCIAGGRMLRDFCREHGIPVFACGKVIVATSEGELGALERLYQRGLENGVTGLALISADQLATIEPQVRGIRAIHVPESAAVDFAKVATNLADLIVQAGGEIRISTELQEIRDENGGFSLTTSGGTIRARYLISCGGLQSDRIARLGGADPEVRILPFRGEYYRLRYRTLVNGHVYPVPDSQLPFLGPHFTRRIDGSIDAGPNAVLALHREGYSRGTIDLRDAAEILGYGGFWRLARAHWREGVGELVRSRSKRAFVRSLARLVPSIQASDLTAGGAGVRAQAVSVNGRLVDDFLLVEHGRAFHVCNAPSPAATAALAIAEEVGRLVEARL
jgi:(S)-2-hydroxyglutarate dehydrogenase